MSNTTAEIAIFATARALPGKEADLAKALRDVAAPTLAQPGCLGFCLYGSEDGSMITAFERWASRMDHHRHLQGAHVSELMARFNGILAGAPTITEMKPL
jgi:quinol monooxygenase YgiN